MIYQANFLISTTPPERQKGKLTAVNLTFHLVVTVIVKHIKVLNGAMSKPHFLIYFYLDFFLAVFTFDVNLSGFSLFIIVLQQLLAALRAIVPLLFLDFFHSSHLKKQRFAEGLFLLFLSSEIRKGVFHLHLAIEFLL